MSDEISPKMEKECPYCSKVFKIDEEGWSDELMTHLLDQHEADIKYDYDILNQVIEENWDDLVNEYERDIKEIFNENEDDIVFKYGDDFIEDAVKDLIIEAEVSEVKDWKRAKKWEKNSL